MKAKSKSRTGIASRFLYFVLMATALYSPEFASALELNSISIKGFLQLRGVGASEQMQSFSQNNLSAVTAVAHPFLNEQPKSLRDSFQVAQSRLLIEYRPNEILVGRYEFDFIDFSKSTPTTTAVPRVRRLSIEYRPLYSDWHFLFGQDWDLVSPLGPFTYNWVSHAFQAGDLGFMRLEGIALHDLNEQNEIATALAFPKSNTSSTDSLDETSSPPVLELRYRYHTPKLQAGFSGLWTRLKSDPVSQNRFHSWTMNLFVEKTFTETFTLRSEGYAGKNTAGTGLQGLSQATNAYGNPFEIGGYLSARVKISNKSALFGLMGIAKCIQVNQVAPMYARIPSLTRVSSNGPGILWNITTMLGFDHELEPHFRFFAQISAHKTRHALLPVDRGSVSTMSAGMTELGFQLDL